MVKIRLPMFLDWTKTRGFGVGLELETCGLGLWLRHEEKFGLATTGLDFISVQYYIFHFICDTSIVHNYTIYDDAPYVNQVNGESQVRKWSDAYERAGTLSAVHVSFI